MREKPYIHTVGIFHKEMNSGVDISKVKVDLDTHIGKGAETEGYG